MSIRVLVMAVAVDCTKQFFEVIFDFGFFGDVFDKKLEDDDKDDDDGDGHFYFFEGFGRDKR